eukprot:2804384-Alexandrium_andersonii.AAC.1
MPWSARHRGRDATHSHRRPGRSRHDMVCSHPQRRCIKDPPPRHIRHSLTSARPALTLSSGVQTPPLTMCNHMRKAGSGRVLG